MGVVDMFDKGACDVFIATEKDIWRYWAEGQLCDVEIVGKPLLSYLTGLFMNDGLRLLGNFAVAEKRLDGTWATLENTMQPLSSCPHSNRDDVGESPKQL